MTDDLISRADAIDALGAEPPVWYDGEDEIAERNQWRRDVDAIKAVPSAQPKRGEWVNVSESWSPNEKCSVCGHIVHEYNYNYCPNCGAKMKGSDDGENIQSAIE